jgi:hypothetical protein
MSEIIIQDTIQQERNIIIPRKKGRPKIHENKQEYIKEYHKKLIKDKGEAYLKKKETTRQYSERCRKAYSLLKSMYEDKEQNIKPEYMEEIIKLFNTVVTVQSTE